MRNLLATIMYDLFHVVQYNYNNDHDLNVLKDFSKKQTILARYGYTVYGESPINDLVHNIHIYINDVSLLNNLTVEQQRANLSLLLRCYILNPSTKNYIKDTEAFIYEISKNFDSYSDDTKTTIINGFQEYLEKDYEF